MRCEGIENLRRQARRAQQIKQQAEATPRHASEVVKYPFKIVAENDHRDCVIELDGKYHVVHVGVDGWVLYTILPEDLKNERAAYSSGHDAQCLRLITKGRARKTAMKLWNEHVINNRRWNPVVEKWYHGMEQV